MKLTKWLLAIALCALAGIAIAQQDNRTPMGGKGDKDAYGQQGQQQQQEDKSQQQEQQQGDDRQQGDASDETEEQPQ